jgi:hypothetical protein
MILETADRWGIAPADVILIAINLFGIDSPTGTNRARLLVDLERVVGDPFHVIVPTNRMTSPLKERGRMLWLARSNPLGRLIQPSSDDAIGGYFRGDGTVITLNPNARSRCVGCAFCPNTLEAAADPRMRRESDTRELLEGLSAVSPTGDLSRVREVTISTGCFERERDAIDYLKLLRRTLTDYGITPTIGLLSSVVLSDGGFHELAAEVGDVTLWFTMECFDRRDLLLKETKLALTPDTLADRLHAAADAGLGSTFNYVVGLDGIDIMTKYLPDACQAVTRFPNFQIYQAHNTLMELIRADGADDLAYYLESRMLIEELMRVTPHSPSSWLNYRSLWYTTYGDWPLTGPRK